MTVPFPTSTVRPPDWIDNLKLGAPATITQTFSSGAESRLQVSAVEVGASFDCYWNPIVYPEINLILNFWRSVGTVEDITLPNDFFIAGCPPDRAALYRAASPTGRWRFKAQPELQEIDLFRQQMIAMLVACVD